MGYARRYSLDVSTEEAATMSDEIWNCPSCGNRNPENWPLRVGDSIKGGGCQSCWEAQTGGDFWEHMKAIRTEHESQVDAAKRLIEVLADRVELLHTLAVAADPKALAKSYLSINRARLRWTEECLAKLKAELGGDRR